MKRVYRLFRSLDRPLRAELRLLRRLIRRRVLVAPKTEEEIVNQFHKLYYYSGDIGMAWHNTYWMGIPTQKCPLDLWIYQEIIWDLKPDLIIECGTLRGGGALYLASLCELVNNGTVVTIDINPERFPTRPQHHRIRYIAGSSTSEVVLEQVGTLVNGHDRVMVILDSLHDKAHVLNELRSYAKFVTKDSYIIVEDTNLNGHPVRPEFGPGPMEAVEQFLTETNDFDVAKERQTHWLTFNPGGFLKKVK